MRLVGMRTGRNVGISRAIKDTRRLQSSGDWRVAENSDHEETPGNPS